MYEVNAYACKMVCTVHWSFEIASKWGKVFEYIVLLMWETYIYSLLSFIIPGFVVCFCPLS